MTESTQETFAFTSHFFAPSGSWLHSCQVPSDGGASLLREVDHKISLLTRLVSCFSDGRMVLLVKHRLPQMLSQRIFGLALTGRSGRYHKIAYSAEGISARGEPIARRMAGPVAWAEVKLIA